MDYRHNYYILAIPCEKGVNILKKNKQIKPSAPYCFGLLLIAEMCLFPL